MPETNLISLMFINLNSVQSNASDARWNSTQFRNVYFTTAPYKRFLNYLYNLHVTIVGKIHKHQELFPFAVYNFLNNIMYACYSI